MKRDASIVLSLLIVVLGVVTFYFQRQAAGLQMQLDALAPVKKRNTELEVRVTTLEQRLTDIRAKEVAPVQRQLSRTTAALSLANRKLIAKDKDYETLRRLFDTSGGRISARDLSMLTKPEAPPSATGAWALLTPGVIPPDPTPSLSSDFGGYSSGSVSVRGYYRRSGTYVSSHRRRR